MLHAEGISRRFGGVRALSGVDVAIHAGEALALVGPNGAGKTTLLRLLAGPAQPDEGTIGRPAAGVGWAPQAEGVYPRLSVRENLAVFARLNGVSDAAARVDELIARAALDEYADARADTLSTGTLQRLNLAIALCDGPAVVLLDEPTATLSPEQRTRLWRWIGEMRADDRLAVGFSTQSVDEATRVADRIMVLVGGECVFAGTPDALAERGEGDPERGYLALAGAGE